MMRSNPASAMQKTYDDCFLICSTAIYFEGQNNEEEALRCWRNALGQINYYNAHRVPPNYRPKSETEKALQTSLHDLELQCKERVDLLEALKESRSEVKQVKDAQSTDDARTTAEATWLTSAPAAPSSQTSNGWLGEGTVPPLGYPELSRPPLPHRASLTSTKSHEEDAARTQRLPLGGLSASMPVSSPSPTLKQKDSRTSSPEKKGGMLRTLRSGGKNASRSSPRMSNTLRPKPPAAAKAATQAWDLISKGSGRRMVPSPAGSTTDPLASSASAAASRERLDYFTESSPSWGRPGLSPSGLRVPSQEKLHETKLNKSKQKISATTTHSDLHLDTLRPQSGPRALSQNKQKLPPVPAKPDVGFLAYRKEYPLESEYGKQLAKVAAARAEPTLSPASKKASHPVTRRKPVGLDPSTRKLAYKDVATSSGTTEEEETSSGPETIPISIKEKGKEKVRVDAVNDRSTRPLTPSSQASIEGSGSESDSQIREWRKRTERVLKHLPRGVDEAAAQQILNEIVVHGDEVHWDDVAGLEVAKAALKETVVYPFLRPDLFMGLREPARGMLLFGPPGTGKTMLARAVATESKSTFFQISASSLTSKYLGESEKLVRALFALAKALAPSIIFVDEIDSLLSSRSGNEHEATRRIKTEFLIQWSDLQKAAAGRETQSKAEKDRGDASRVLVLAATNLPWAIDEAARRRFVRRQYIPLPEPHVRKLQLKTLLSHQKHDIGEEELNELVRLTDGFSGSDITALAKDAAMGPLRSLGEKLLHMTMDDIRPIRFEDFQASLKTIRPSVSKQGLKEFEDWAAEFGERGG